MTVAPRSNNKASFISLHQSCCLLFALALLLGGCAVWRPAAEPALEAPQAAPPPDAASLAKTLYQRGRSLDSMQTAAVMEYRGADQHVKAREQIAIRRPAGMRVEAFSPFGVAVVVVANEREVEIFEPSKNILYKGRASASTLSRFVHIPLAPTAAVNLLLGLAPDNDALVGAPTAAREEDGLVVASYNFSGGGSQELGFANGQLARVRSFAAGGQLQYEVHYDAYQDIGGILFASSVDASFPQSQTQVKLNYQRPIVNGPIDDAAFTLSPGAATSIVNLDGSAPAPRAGS